MHRFATVSFRTSVARHVACEMFDKRAQFTTVGALKDLILRTWDVEAPKGKAAQGAHHRPTRRKTKRNQ